MDDQATGGADHEQRYRLFRSVQYLRAVAAIMVLLYHVGYLFAFVADGPMRPHWLSAGVDIFFLISGFVMVVSTEKRRPGGLRFFEERLARIVPLYWLVTAAFVAIMAAQDRALPSPGEIGKALLFVFYTNPRTLEPSPIVTPGWTLNYEMIFYLLFALLIRVPVNRRIAAMAGLYLCLCALRPFVPHDDALLFRLTSPQPLEFVAGMVVGQLRFRLLRLPPALGVAAILGGFVGLALIDSGLSRVVQFAPCATAIMAGTIVCEQWVRREIGPLRLLGDSSYSLYLTHPLVLEMLTGTGLALGWRIVAALATVLGCIVVALGFYRGFELPVIRLMRRRLKGHPALAPVG